MLRLARTLRPVAKLGIINDFHQGQTLRRGGFTRELTLAGRKRLTDRHVDNFSSPDREKRADDGAHHVTKESVCADCYLDDRASCTFIGMRAHHDIRNRTALSFSIRLRRRESSPIMQTQKQFGASTHALKIKWASFVVSVTKPEGRHYWSINHAVKIGLP